MLHPLLARAEALKDRTEVHGWLSGTAGLFLSKTAINNERKLYNTALLLAQETLHMPTCAGVRLGNGLKHITGLTNANKSTLLAWLPGTSQCWEMELNASWGVDFSKLLGKYWKECAFLQLYDFPSNIQIPDGRIELDSSISSQKAQPSDSTPTNPEEDSDDLPQETSISDPEAQSGDTTPASADSLPPLEPGPASVPVPASSQSGVSSSARSTPRSRNSSIPHGQVVEPADVPIPNSSGSQTTGTGSNSISPRNSTPSTNSRAGQSTPSSEWRTARSQPSTPSTRKSSSSREEFREAWRKSQPSAPGAPEDPNNHTDEDEQIEQLRRMLKDILDNRQRRRRTGRTRRIETQRPRYMPDTVRVHAGPTPNSRSPNEPLEIELAIPKRNKDAPATHAIIDLNHFAASEANGAPIRHSKCFKVARDFDIISPEEQKKHYHACREAKKKEIKSFIDHKVFDVRLRKRDRDFSKPVFINDIKAIWVMRWKLKDGKKIVKARLCLQGFRDKQTMDSVSSSTATRIGQRLIASVAANHNWNLLCLDISTAFLQGLTFEDLAKLTGDPKRSVQMSPPSDVWELLKELKAHPLLAKHSAADCSKLYMLHLIKCVYGLNDAPKAWQLRLDKQLKPLGYKPFQLDKCIYSLHDK